MEIKKKVIKKRIIFSLASSISFYEFNSRKTTEEEKKEIVCNPISKPMCVRASIMFGVAYLPSMHIHFFLRLVFVFCFAFPPFFHSFLKHIFFKLVISIVRMVVGCQVQYNTYVDWCYTLHRLHTTYNINLESI